VVNPNIQQPYYTAHAYGPGAPQLVPNACFPKPPIFPAVTSNTTTGKSDNVRDQVARTLRELGLEPRGHVKTYQKPYREFFTMCHIQGVSGCLIWLNSYLGSDTKTTYEHVGQFLA
jgi:hypothetical protein